MSRTRPRRRRWGHGTAAIARHLHDASEPATQLELAERAGVTQPAVSKALKHLAEQGAAIDQKPGWFPDRRLLLRAYWHSYSSRLDDRETWWYRIDEHSAQIADLIELHPSVVVSGDYAADILSPWRFPDTTIIYSHLDTSDMETRGFVPADDRTVASIISRPVPDPRFTEDTQDVRSITVAHPLHVAADLLALSADRREQAERLVAP